MPSLWGKPREKRRVWESQLLWVSMGRTACSVCHCWRCLPSSGSVRARSLPWGCPCQRDHPALLRALRCHCPYSMSLCHGNMVPSYSGDTPRHKSPHFTGEDHWFWCHTRFLFQTQFSTDSFRWARENLYSQQNTLLGGCFVVLWGHLNTVR